MILKGGERGDAPQLARYLLQMRDNEHVELHEVRGFASEDLPGAFREAEAISKGTRCRKHLFSMSLNPPSGEDVPIQAFEDAIDRIEQKLGLTGQPRAIVFHEKDGRRHAHAVWSQIDGQKMRAINLPHWKRKLTGLSRELFREHGWMMPKGLRDPRERDPLTFSREEWQQARRHNLDPKQIKAIFRESWQASDNQASFAQALQERGFWLAKGDRRGFVAIDYKGEIYAVARWTGIRTKEVRDRLGNPDKLPSVDQAKAEIARRMTNTLQGYIKEVERDANRRSTSIDMKRADMTARHRAERERLNEAHEKRWIAETNTRAERLTKGLKGVWHWLTGRNRDIRKQNEKEAWQAHLRDRAEKDALILRQLNERDTLQREIAERRRNQQEELLRLRADVIRYREMEPRDKPDREYERDDDQGRKRETRRRRRRRDREGDPGPNI